MKKLILSLLSVAAIATSANAQLAIAPELGLNMANMTGKSGGTSSDYKMKAGLAVGAVIDFGLTDNLYLQPGLFYLMNGAKANVGDATINVNTIQIPINFVYKLGEEGDNRFFFGVGPYIGYNLSASVKSGGNSTTINIGTDKTADGIKPMDFGVGLNLGYLLSNGIFVRAHYQMGLANLDPISDADNTLKTSAIGLTVGYYFGAHKGGHKAKGGAKKK